MFNNNQQFKLDPRDYALQLIEDQLVDPEEMLRCALSWMSHDDVRKMLDTNELSPRFLNQ